MSARAIPPMMAVPASTLPTGDGVDVRGEVGRLPRAGRQERRHRFAGVSQSQEHDQAVPVGRERRFASEREIGPSRRRNRRARRQRPAVVSGAASRQPRGAVDRVLRLRPAASERPRSDARAARRAPRRCCATSIGDSGVLLSDALPGTPAQIAAAVRRLRARRRGRQAPAIRVRRRAGAATPGSRFASRVTRNSSSAGSSLTAPHVRFAGGRLLRWSRS